MGKHSSRRIQTDPLKDLENRLLLAKSKQDMIKIYRDCLPRLAQLRPAEAIVKATEAQRLSADMAINIEFIRLRGTAFLLQHDPLPAIEDFNCTFAYYEELGESCKAAEALIGLGEAAMMLKNPICAIEKFQMALERCEAPCTSSRAIALEHLGKLYLSISEYPLAVENLLGAIEIFNDLNEQEKSGAALGMLGTIYSKIGPLDKAYEYHLESVKAFEGAGDSSNLVRALANVASTQYAREEFKDAHLNALKAEEICERSGDYINKAYMKILIGDIRRGMDPTYSELGNYLDAYKLLQKYRSDDLLLGLLDRIGRYHLRAGDWNAVQHVFSVGLTTAENLKDRYQQAHFHQMLASSYEARESFPEALFHYKHFSELQLAIAGEERQRAIEELQIKHDLAKKEKAWKREIERIDTERHSALAEAEELRVMMDRTDQDLCEAKIDLTGMMTTLSKLLTIAEQAKAASPDGTNEIVIKMIKKLQHVGKEKMPDPKQQNRREWARLKQQIDEMHPGFRQRLFDRCPTLTEALVKLCCLTRLGYETTEIAERLGNTPGTVRLQRSNTRKELGIPSDVNFFEFISHI